MLSLRLDALRPAQHPDRGPAPALRSREPPSSVQVLSGPGRTLPPPGRGRPERQRRLHLDPLRRHERPDRGGRARSCRGACSGVQALSTGRPERDGPQAGVDASRRRRLHLDALRRRELSDPGSRALAAGTLERFVQVLSPAGQNAAQPRVAVRSRTATPSSPGRAQTAPTPGSRPAPARSAGTLEPAQMLSLAGQNATHPRSGSTRPATPSSPGSAPTARTPGSKTAPAPQVGP